MPINKDLNVAPYFDDFDLTKQFYRVLFKPSYAVQARELTQMQTMLQNQIEQFGDNIFKEGSIVKGCNFTALDDLNYVKVTDKFGFDVTQFVGFIDEVVIGGITYQRDNSYELRGSITGVTASVVAATRGFETRNPDLNTFYINYTTTSSGNKVFQAGESLTITKVSTVEVGTSISRTTEQVETINVTTFSGAVGNSFALKSSPGIIFQKGHFLYSEEQLVIVSKYNNVPNNMSVGFTVEERLINAFQDPSLYDNANGSSNQNAPGADRLKLIPVLTAIPTVEADADTTFFTLTRYSNGNAVQVRDVSQYNVIGEEMAKRTYEESGDYIVEGFKSKIIRRDGTLKASVGSGIAYVKGYRVENLAEVLLDIDDIDEASFDTRTNQAIAFNYGGYLSIDASANTSGTVSIDDFSTVSLVNASEVEIGRARVRNITDDKIFLFDMRLSANTSATISDIVKITGDTGFLTIAPSSIINEASSASMVFRTGAINLKSVDGISLPVRTSALKTSIGNIVTIEPSTGADFNLGNDDILVVDASNIKYNVVNLSLSGSDLVIELDSTPSADVTVYYNERFSNASNFTKISANLFVKTTVQASDATLGNVKYNLGFPDVYEIISIIDAGGNDVTTSFKLRTNQRDNYYDHSYIEFIPGRVFPANGLMTISFRAFKLNAVSGKYFFTVNSYAGSGVTGDKIKPFVSSSGATYNLLDSIDFRPYVTPIGSANYTNAALIGTAPTVSNSSTGVNVQPAFDPSYRIITPAHNQFAQLDYDFYFGRIDAVTIDSYGKTSIVKGTETENAIPPNITGDQLKIAEIFVPGIPALTPEESSAQNRTEYSAKIIPKGTKSYKMRDIETIERKLDTLAYYVLLSSIETDTNNLNITDENGLTRFKNGIIVDPFNDLNTANLDNTEFSAAIDFSEKSLMPAVKTFPLNMKYKTSTGATLFPTTANAKTGSLQRDADVSLVSQPYATEFRNCVSNFYSYRGIGELSPEYDTVYDTVTNPISIDIDLITPFSQLVDGLQEFIPMTSTRSELLRSVSAVTSQTARRTETTTTTTFRDTTRSVQVTGEQTNTQNVGDFVSNFTFNPFMRAREIRVYASGLRPNTQHYFFFDQKNVDEFIIPGSPVNRADLIRRNGFANDPVVSDASGVVRAVFNLPEATFYVGDRNLEIADVDAYAAIESASTSYAVLTYRAYNFSVEKSSLTASTRTPETFASQITSERSVTRRAIVDNGGGDPIAQTFFIKKGMGLGSDTVFISKLDIYFKRRSSINGVTIELREVTNGYPSYTILPFSKVHLTPSQVNTSDNASVVTTVEFPAPIRLDVEKEYAFVVIPDAADPDYLIFTSKVGGVDLTPGPNQGLAVVQDWGDGVLFTSTNGRAWQSYQDEDIKFNLYRHNFSASTGSITLTNDDHEFITTVNNIGKFSVGEIVYKREPSDGLTANTVSVVSGNNQITGTELSATYSAGDYILLDDGLDKKQIFRVDSANSTVIVADRPASFTDAAIASPVTLGTLTTYNFRYPNFLILESSSANAERKFAEDDVIFGFDSGATATIGSVDNIEFSYLQPMIMRTNDSVTRTTLSGTFTNPANPTETYTQQIAFNDKTTFNNLGMVVFSKSNDIPRTKAMNLTVSMSNAGNVTSSPFIDVETSTVLAYQWKIANTPEGRSKYISKTVQLAENLDAEDFNIYVTGYRPFGTDIKVYIKPQAASDPADFNSNDWIELELTQGISLYSSLSNIYDFKEFLYKVKDADKNTGVLNYSNEFGTFQGFRRFAVRIELLSENIFKAPRLLDYRGIALT